MIASEPAKTIYWHRELPPLERKASEIGGAS